MDLIIYWYVLCVSLAITCHGRATLRRWREHSGKQSDTKTNRTFERHLTSSTNSANAVNSATLVDLSEPDSIPERTHGNKAEDVVRLQIIYLAPTLLAYFSDWVQGSYLYVHLAQTFELNAPTINGLLLTGYLFSGIASFFCGAAVDVIGRKRGAFAACICHLIACLTLQCGSHSVLFLGRIVSGIGTALLCTSFEAWLVAESLRRHFSEADLSRTFALVGLGNGVDAVIAGVVAGIAKHLLGLQRSFLVPVGTLIVAAGLIAVTWRENTAKSVEEICLQGESCASFRAEMELRSQQSNPQLIIHSGECKPIKIPSSSETKAAISVKCKVPRKNDIPVPDIAVVYGHPLPAARNHDLSPRRNESQVCPAVAVVPAKLDLIENRHKLERCQSSRSLSCKPSSQQHGPNSRLHVCQQHSQPARSFFATQAVESGEAVQTKKNGSSSQLSIASVSPFVVVNADRVKTGRWIIPLVDSRFSRQLYLAATAMSQSDQLVLCCIIQTAIELAIFVFIVQWTPALPLAVNHSQIFTSMMLAFVVGTGLYSELCEGRPLARSKTMCAALFVLAGAAFLLASLQTAANIRIAAFVFIELVAGFYSPAFSVIRNAYLPENCRATVLCLFRVPSNVFLVIVLLSAHILTISMMFCVCAAACCTAAVATLGLLKYPPLPPQL